MQDYKIKLDILEGEELYSESLGDYTLVRDGELWCNGRPRMATPKLVNELYQELCKSAISEFEHEDFSLYV